jgi:uncharacterized protein (TIGR03083 family)
VKIIETSRLFPLLDGRLIELLRSLSAEEWSRLATPKWTVKDVAGHLLDGNLRRLSMARDGYYGESFSGNSPQEFVAFLTGLNADWVRAMKRLSPQVLIELLAETGGQVSEYFGKLDPHGQAVFAVSWAGEETSENWFDIAREYTEKWHHQQQIREAVGKGVGEIMTRELYFPVLDTFMRALPFCYRQVDAREGATVAVHVKGEAGGSWYLRREGAEWVLAADSEVRPDAEASIPEEAAWKLFTKGLSPEAAEKYLARAGDPGLTAQLTKVLAIIG